MIISGPLTVPPMGPGRQGPGWQGQGPRPWCPFYRQRMAAMPLGQVPAGFCTTAGSLGSVDKPSNPFEALAWVARGVARTERKVAAANEAARAVAVPRPKAPALKPLKLRKRRG